MKVILRNIFILFILSTYLFAQPVSVLDSIPKFRGIEWGEHIQIVKALEWAKYEQISIGFGVKILTFSGSLLDHDVKIDYVFVNDTLTESFYTIQTNSFPESYKKVKEFYFDKLGLPNYWSSSHPDSSIDWAKESDEIFCRGPEIYWEYCNGFIGIISERYKEEISISILYVYNKTIEDYGKYVIYPYESLVKK